MTEMNVDPPADFTDEHIDFVNELTERLVAAWKEGYAHGWERRAEYERQKAVETLAG